MFTLNCKGRLLVIEKPLVMGIINVTPDSFLPEAGSKEPMRFYGKQNK
jgi:dihydropteroate synthase